LQYVFSGYDVRDKLIFKNVKEKNNDISEVKMNSRRWHISCCVVIILVAVLSVIIFLKVNNMKAAQCAINPMQASLNSLDYTVIGSYMNEIGRHRLLSKAETRRLAMRVFENDDRQAGRKLVVGNLRLVVKMVMNFQRYWKDNFLDLVQEGNFGLVKAVDKFDPNKGVKFSSYAAYWIRAYILKFIMDNWRLVKIGTTQAQRKLFYRLNKERKLLESQGVKPENAELAERLDVREKDVDEMTIRMNNCDVSLEAPTDDSNYSQKIFACDRGCTALKCSTPPVEKMVEDNEYFSWFRKELENVKQKLNAREQVILFERLLSEEPRTLSNIAEQFSISRERVRQIESALLGKLKQSFI
jgi:RNA polymerase sigma-32 factor